MDEELKQVLAMQEAQLRATAERKAQIAEMLAEVQAELVQQGADPISVRMYGSLTVEAALLDAMDANQNRVLRALADGFGGG